MRQRSHVLRRAALGVVISLLAATISTAFIIENRLSVEQQQTPTLPNLEIPLSSAFSPATDGDTAMVSPREPLTDQLAWEREADFLSRHIEFLQGTGPNLRVRPDALVTPTQSTKRILVVGDSFVWGEGHQDLEQRWHRRLQAELDERAGLGTYEVTALGRRMTSTVRISEWLSPELMKELRPDAVIVTYSANDVIPSFEEKRYCRKLGTCLETDDANSVIGGRVNKELLTCMRGEDGVVGWFIRHALNPYLPRLTAKVVARFCDPDRINAEKRLETESDGGNNPTASQFWPDFVDAVNVIGVNVSGTPLFVMPALNHIGDAVAAVAPLREFSRAGFVVIEPSATRTLLDSFPVDSRSLWVSPSDRHPGPRLTRAYASDAADTLLKVLPPVAPSVASAAKGPTSLVTGWLPAQLQLEETDGAASLTLPIPCPNCSYAVENWKVNSSGAGRPTQQVPCAALGRPHVRIGLSRTALDADALRLFVRGMVTDRYIVQTLGHDSDGNEVRRTAFEVPAGEALRIPIWDGLDTLLVASADADGCDYTKDISMDAMQVEIVSLND